MNIIVGSTALEYFGLSRRVPVDIDVWTDDESFEKDGIMDVCKIPTEILLLVDQVDGYATPDSIYTIKLSHAVYDIKFEKTKLDILHLKHHGCRLIQELYEVLKVYWVKEHGNKDFLSLNKSKEDFFTDNVYYEFPHDYLHQLVAYPHPPMYTKCLKDNHEVLIDKAKFKAMSLEDQIRMFREEITVIAAERWLIPKKWHGKISWYRAYMLSLQKTVVSLTKGDYSYFLVENLEKFVKSDYKMFSKTINLNQEEYNMSEVDLKVFKDLMAVGISSRDPNEDAEEDLDYVIHKLCENNFGGIINIPCNDYKQYQSEIKALEKEWDYEHLTQEGGGEGGSEYCYGVFRLKGVVYKAEYNYYSHEGDNYDGIVDTLKVVKPVEKTIVVWE